MILCRAGRKESYMADEGRYPVQRAHPRFAVDMDARISTDMGRYKVRTHDLSRGGISVYVPFPLDSGSTFTIELALIFGQNAQSEPLVLLARVVWCTHHQDGYQVGASFLSIDDQTRQYLQMFLNFLSEGLQSENSGDDDGGPDLSGEQGAGWYGS